MMIQTYTIESGSIRTVDISMTKPTGFSGARLRNLRKAKGWGQVELANRAATTQGMISYYERDRQVPNANILAQIAAALETTMDYLVQRTDDPKPLNEQERALIDSYRRRDWKAFKAFQKSAVDRLEDRLREDSITPFSGE